VAFVTDFQYHVSEANAEHDDATAAKIKDDARNFAITPISFYEIVIEAIT